MKILVDIVTFMCCKEKSMILVSALGKLYSSPGEHTSEHTSSSEWSKSLWCAGGHDSHLGASALK